MPERVEPMDLVTEQKLERRARILRAARELIAERGYREITVRDLAQRCRVSVPTLYNQFGGKDAVLAAAVEAHFREVLASVATDTEPPGAGRVLALVERCAREMARLSDYHQALVLAFATARETGPLQETLATELAAALAVRLGEMQRRRQLVAWAEVGPLATQITSACISASVVWSRGSLGAEGLRAFMLHATALLLLGVARGAARKEIETAARSAQALLGSDLERIAPRPEAAPEAARR